MDLDIYEVTVK